MPKPKYRKYQLIFKGDGEIVAMIEKYVSKECETMAEAFAKRRAIIQVFGDKVDVRVLSRRVYWKPDVRDITR